jgi:hypothetical protein
MVVLPHGDSKSKSIASDIENLIYRSFVAGEVVSQEIVK